MNIIRNLIREELLRPFFGLMFGGTEIKGIYIGEIAMGITEIIIYLLILRFLLIQAIKIYKKEIKKD